MFNMFVWFLEYWKADAVLFFITYLLFYRHLKHPYQCFPLFLKFHNHCVIRSETGIHILQYWGHSKNCPHVCAEHCWNTLPWPCQLFWQAPSPWASAAAGCAHPLAASKSPIPSSPKGVSEQQGHVNVSLGGDMTTWKQSGQSHMQRGVWQNSQRVVVHLGYVFLGMKPQWEAAKFLVKMTNLFCFPSTAAGPGWESWYAVSHVEKVGVSADF